MWPVMPRGLDASLLPPLVRAEEAGALRPPRFAGTTPLPPLRVITGARWAGHNSSYWAADGQLSPIQLLP